MTQQTQKGPWWPYTKAPVSPVTEGPWKAGISAGGSVVLWPSEKPFPEDLGLIESFRGEREELDMFTVQFCKLGYLKDDRHVHQNGDEYILNWRSFTLAQVFIAAQVFAAMTYAYGQLEDGFPDRAKTYMKLARTIGKKFQAAIEEAKRGE